MRRTGRALIVAAVVALSGCTAAPSDALPRPETSASGSGDVTAFLEHLKTTWVGPIPDEDVLLSYGEAACTQLETGRSPGDVEVLEPSEAASTDAAANTRSIVDAASLSLCPAISPN